jgi:hypothetical protein
MLTATVEEAGHVARHERHLRLRGRQSRRDPVYPYRTPSSRAQRSARAADRTTNKLSMPFTCRASLRHASGVVATGPGAVSRHLRPSIRRRDARDPCSNACSNAADFAAVRECSPMSQSLALLRIRTLTNGDERAAEVWGSRGRRFKSCHPDGKQQVRGRFGQNLRRPLCCRVATGVATAQFSPAHCC